MNALYFVYGILATLLIFGIIAGLSDYEDLKNRVRNNACEIRKMGEAIAHVDKKLDMLIEDLEEDEDEDA